MKSNSKIYAFRILWHDDDKHGAYVRLVIVDDYNKVNSLEDAHRFIDLDSYESILSIKLIKHRDLFVDDFPVISVKCEKLLCEL